MHCNSNTLGVHTLQLTPEALSYQEFPYFLCTKFTLCINGITFPVFKSPPQHTHTCSTLYVAESTPASPI